MQVHADFQRLLLTSLLISLHCCYLLVYTCIIIIVIGTIGTAAVTEADNNINLSRISLKVFPVVHVAILKSIYIDSKLFSDRYVYDEHRIAQTYMLYYTHKSTESVGFIEPRIRTKYREIVLNYGENDVAPIGVVRGSGAVGSVTNEFVY